MNDVEKGKFLKLFIKRGYVMDFTTEDFNIFTIQSVGIPLCSKYDESKGKSLTYFVMNDASKSDTIKLLSDLLKYYESHCMDPFMKEEELGLYEECRRIMDREENVYSIEIPNISNISNEYIADIVIRANRDIDNREFDSAITKARTLLEEVFINALESIEIEPDRSGDINRLFKQVKNNYNMHSNENVDDRIKKLIGGLNSIVSAIAELRNIESDAHGVGKKRYGIDIHHARLFVNSAQILSEFVLSVARNKNKHIS